MLTVFFAVAGLPAMAQEIVDSWRYTLRPPGEGWRAPKFDDSKWTVGNGGFGTYDTPGSRVGTIWSTNSIWLRKTVSLTEIPEKPALLMHHDEDAEVFLNGMLVTKKNGYTTEYIVVPLEEKDREVLKSGPNVMAVHCRQTGGGQFIDVHLVDANKLPTLPAPKRNTKPFISELITEWGSAVKPENAWREYPRPALVRENWQNLNGQWDYAVSPIDQKQAPSAWDGKILVPFCLESKLGGVQRLLDSTEALWYHRVFTAAPKAGERTLLNFEAVDYRCEVVVNGTTVGEHQGGNTPFTMDVTTAVRNGENDLVVRVTDDTEGWQLRGKQVLNARGIWYTQVSGIWQTVWLEQVSASYLEDVKITAEAAAEIIYVRPLVRNGRTGQSVQVTMKDGKTVVATFEIKADASGQFPQGSVTVAGVKLWSPSSPHLYDLEIVLKNTDGSVADSVTSYAGVRSSGRVRDGDGHWRMALNGRPLFHWGPLDQGWWPDGLLTPPSDSAMVFDIEFLKQAGFNMIRKHIKVEPRRYYYHCDRLGMMVWQDQVSAGHNPPWTRLEPNPRDADWPDVHHQQFMVELERMVNELENHPCITVWVPFNEAWGQHRTVEVGEWLVKRDPFRMVNVASGGNFWPAGHIVDEHAYPHPSFPFHLGEGGRFDAYVKVMGEFGGHGYPVRDHLWDPDRQNWGYGGLPKNEAEFRERYETSLKMLNDLRKKGISAGVYTQTTDVEGEINGLMTYDRKVIKIPAKELAELHRILFEE
ncbi:MAG: glycoside hydrolase family 2 TIM barrel-domain containing protein [Planctomycetaceae bacterium]